MWRWFLVAVSVIGSSATYPAYIVSPQATATCPSPRKIATCEWTPDGSMCEMHDWSGDCSCVGATAVDLRTTLAVNLTSKYRVTMIDHEIQAEGRHQFSDTPPRLEVSVDAIKWMNSQVQLDERPLSLLVRSTELIAWPTKFPAPYISAYQYHVIDAAHAQYFRITPSWQQGQPTSIASSLYGCEAQLGAGGVPRKRPRVALVDGTKYRTEVNLRTRPFVAASSAFVLFSLPRRNLPGQSAPREVTLHVIAVTAGAVIPWDMARVSLAARASCQKTRRSVNATLFEQHACDPSTALAWPVQAEARFQGHYRADLVAVIPADVDTSLRGCGCATGQNPEVVFESWVVMISSEVETDVSITIRFRDTCDGAWKWSHGQESCRCQSLDLFGMPVYCRPGEARCCRHNLVQDFLSLSLISGLLLASGWAVRNFLQHGWHLIRPKLVLALFAGVASVAATLNTFFWLHVALKTVTSVWPGLVNLAEIQETLQERGFDLLDSTLSIFAKCFNWLDDVLSLIDRNHGRVLTASAVILAFALRKDILLRVDAYVRGDTDAEGMLPKLRNGLAWVANRAIRKCLRVVLFMASRSLWSLASVGWALPLFCLFCFAYFSGLVGDIKIHDGRVSFRHPFAAGQQILMLTHGDWTTRSLDEYKVHDRAARYRGTKQGMHNRLTLDITVRTRALVWLLLPGGTLALKFAEAVNSPPALYDKGEGKPFMAFDISLPHSLVLRRLAMTGYFALVFSALLGSVVLMFVGILCYACHAVGTFLFPTESGEQASGAEQEFEQQEFEQQESEPEVPADQVEMQEAKRRLQASE